MPRDGSGNYTLPAGNPVATGTIIASAWANPTMADIAVQLNNVLTRDGVLGPVNPFKLVDGAIATPGLAFNSEPGLGIYRPGASVINWAAQNAIPMVLDASVGTSTGLGVYPRLTGTANAVLALANQPRGTTNRTEMALTMTTTGATLAQTGFGTGTKLGLQVDCGAHSFLSTGGATTTVELKDTSGGSNSPHLKFTSSGGSQFMRFSPTLNLEWVNNAYSAVIASLTNAGVFTANNVGIFSDERLKENAVHNMGSRAKLAQLKGMMYQLIARENDDEWEHGLIAQEVQKVYPHLVYENEQGMLAVKYWGFIGELINALNELPIEVK